MSRLDAVQDVLDAALADVPAPGAVVALSTPDGPVSFASGTTTVDGDEPVRTDHWFEIGSVTKVLTATAAMRLVEGGRLDLDQPVLDLLPALRLDDAGRTAALRVRHLLTHTSGIDAADDFTDTGSDDDCLARVVTEVVAGAATFHDPGDRWSYCNVGYSLLGRVIEVVSGRPWDDVLHELVLAPCAMDAATFRRLPAGIARAPGHTYDHEVGRAVPEARTMPASVGPAGNVAATAAALVGFAERATAGEADGGLLRDETRARMLTPEVRAREAAQGVGWALPDAPVRLAVHGGQTPGFTALLTALVDLRGAMAVLANGPGAVAIGLRVQQHLFGTPPPEPPAAVPADDALLDAACGTYERRHVTQHVERDGDGLLIHTEVAGPLLGLFPQPDARAHHVGAGRFASDLPDGTGQQLWDLVDVDGEPMLFSTRLHRRLGDVHPAHTERTR